MSDLSKIDKNFLIKPNINKENVKFYSADEKPFKVHGLIKENGAYVRMPIEVAQKVSVGVHGLSYHTAGGRVRFITDSRFVAIRVEMHRLFSQPHMTQLAAQGFDLYADNVYIKPFLPPELKMEHGFESVIDIGPKKFRDITINFPYSSGVKNLYIGLEEDATVKEPTPYKNSKPVVYYGSSITQGGCASRPGMIYEAIISRKFNLDFINLGFSGSAKAEDEMIDYVKKLDMPLFVYDYDHNAPSVEHLANTHEKMFLAVRKEHPTLPIIIMSRPKYNLTPEEEKRLEIIETTYKNALSAGDKNVYFISGRTLTELCQDEGTVDNIHPTDYGFASIARALEKVIEKIDLK